MERSKHGYILDTLKAGILDGKYGDGRPLPSATALMKKFGVARGTVDRAMAELEHAGLVEKRKGSGTYPVKREPVTFAVILPETVRPFHAAICNGLANCAKRSGGGAYSLLWASGDILSFVALCVAEKIAGVFFEPLKGKTKLNGAVISNFRAAKIPVLLIGGDAASKRTMCDILGVNTLAGGRRTPILFTSTAARRNSSLIAHGELLGDVALRLMLQRIAHPQHPPCELYLDIPGDRVSRRGQSAKR